MKRGGFFLLAILFLLQAAFSSNQNIAMRAARPDSAATEDSASLTPVPVETPSPDETAAPAPAESPTPVDPRGETPVGMAGEYTPSPSATEFSMATPSEAAMEAFTPQESATPPPAKTATPMPPDATDYPETVTLSPTSMETPAIASTLSETPSAIPTGTETPNGTPSTPVLTSVIPPTETPSPIPAEQTPSATPSVAEIPTETPSPTLTPTSPAAGTPSPSPTLTPTSPAAGTPSPSPTPTPTSSATGTPSPSPTSAEAAKVFISEVAWAGTGASANDEWIELWNPSAAAVDLGGWMLTDGGNIRVALAGIIGPGSFFLLERTDDTNVSDIAADLIYSGSLSNSGESLSLYDSLGRLSDSANADGGFWPAGSVAGFATMERMETGAVSDSVWCTNDGIHRNGQDASGNPINGTPRAAFSGFCAAGATSPTPTITPTISATFTPTVRIAGTPFPPLSVMINEVAWAGTSASANDEWIELFNPGPDGIDLTGWVLTDGGDVHIPLAGGIPAGGLFLLERTNDGTVRDIAADQIFKGGLANGGETLRLIDPTGAEIDTANREGGAWPAGKAASPPASMERRSVGPDSRMAWCTNDGIHRNGEDANGNPVHGSPKAPFSGYCRLPTPTATATVTGTPYPPLAVVINEVAWAGTSASANDEWIELHNPGPGAIDLSGWMLTDGGDIHIHLEGGIPPGGFFLLERTDDGTVRDIAADQIYKGGLANDGEALRLIDPTGAEIDTANREGGEWPGGSAKSPPASMERRSVDPDSRPAWCTNDGIHRNGLDADGNPIHGSPKLIFSGHCLALSPTPTRSPTPTLTPTFSGTAYPSFSVVINEVAWAGTSASSSDEWIELYNPGPAAVDLSGWTLTDGGDVGISLGGSIPAGGYYLLERGDDTTLSDIPANLTYTGGLSNTGEVLQLIDPTWHEVDRAGEEGSSWPAGGGSPAFATMERARLDPPVWTTNNGWTVNGRDAQGAPVRGTPGRANSALFPTPAPTGLPNGILINEFLPKPESDWNGDGTADLKDEFIEILNTGSYAVDLKGWMLDDVPGKGSRPFVFDHSVVLQPGEYRAFFRKETRIALNDGGDEVWLFAPGGRRLDGIVYTKTRWPDSAWNRYPDGEGVLRLGFPPTPGGENRLPPELLVPADTVEAPPTDYGWRRQACRAGVGPVLAGDGFPTTGDESAIRLARGLGWFTWRGDQCYAWVEPQVDAGIPLGRSSPRSRPGDYGLGWYWEAWFIR